MNEQAESGTPRVYAAIADGFECSKIYACQCVSVLSAASKTQLQQQTKR